MEHTIPETEVGIYDPAIKAASCPAGEARYQRFYSATAESFQYLYRTPEGELFITVAADLITCRQRRDAWIKEREC